MNLLDLKIQQGGGVIAGPQGLGIFVGEARSVVNVPAGWIFVDSAQPPKDTQAILDALASGRSNWPKDAT